MRDTELYRHLLGLEAPWTVTRVDLDVAGGRADVWEGHPPRTRWTCPACARALPTHDHGKERSWRHLDSCQFLTDLHAAPPRVACPEHGMRQVRLPWAEPMSRFTTLFECLAVDVLKACDVQGAARLLRLSWDEAWHLVERAVGRGQAAKPVRLTPHLGVDEKTVGRGQTYVTVVSDLERGTVEYLADARKQSSLDGYWAALTPAQRAGIEAVAMDMWEPYRQAVRAHLEDTDGPGRGGGHGPQTREPDAARRR